jgi:Mn2+/Fe2+ NRAMP family transporter
MKKSSPSFFKRLTAGKYSGAAFLMATSAIGPGFITQTTVFTQELFTSFGFVILLSVVIDLVVQLNIWRVVAVTKLQGPAVAEKVFPGLGSLLILLVAAGGLIFNIGNIGGCGLALETLLGMSTKSGAIASCLIAILLFIHAEFGRIMDAFTKILALVMVGLTLYTALASQPPMGDIIQHTFIPVQFSLASVITIVGGTVGGYISFAGAHRMLDSSGSESINLHQTDRTAVQGILLASVMRFLLFIAAAGVIATGVILPASNPAAAVFEASAGILGLKLFGIVLWAAAITSVVGAAYTSVSFLQTLHPFIRSQRRWFIIAFIIISTMVFTIAGNPVYILVKAGAINGIVLPLSLTIILVASSKKSIIKNYRHPSWLKITGWLVVAALAFMSVRIIVSMF